jgi:SEC-C motif-containing protein
MRSRYSAYALGLADYLILTTDPVSHSAKGNRDSWKKKILEFSNRTLFEDLTIISHEEKSPEEAAVTFIAHLKQGNKDASFKEESRFRKLNGQWLYTDGKVTDL